MTVSTTPSPSLDEIYERAEAAPETSAAAETTPETTGEQPQQADPAGQQPAATAAADQTQGAPPAPGTSGKPDGEWAPIKALQQEREKRQKLERDFADLQRKLMEPTAKKAEAPDPLVDPAGYQKHILDTEWQERVDGSRLDLIDEVGEEDLSQKERAFIAAAEKDQALAIRLRKSRDPARFAYNQGKKLLEQQQQQLAQPSQDAAAAMRAQIKAELMAELGLAPAAAAQPGNSAQSAPAASAAQAPAAQARAPKPQLPVSLAGVQSAQVRTSGPQAVVHRSLDSLYD